MTSDSWPLPRGPPTAKTSVGPLPHTLSTARSSDVLSNTNCQAGGSGGGGGFCMGGSEHPARMERQTKPSAKGAMEDFMGINLPQRPTDRLKHLRFPHPPANHRKSCRSYNRRRICKDIRLRDPVRCNEESPAVPG